MILTHPQTNLNSVLDDLMKQILKHELNHNIKIENEYIAYEIDTGLKEKRGIIYEWNAAPNFVKLEIKNPQMWEFLKQTIKNPYTCCDNLFVNVTHIYFEVFCIHSCYLSDEIQSLLI